MKQVTVVAAVIRKNDTVFCCQRNETGLLGLKWEFPGGKVELGETHQKALQRELKEELNITALIGEFLTTVTHQYETFHLTMHCYYVDHYQGSIELLEHIDAAWCKVVDLSSLDWAAADVPIVGLLEGIANNMDM